MLKYLALGLVVLTTLHYATAQQCSNTGTCSPTSPTCYSRTVAAYQQAVTRYRRGSSSYYYSCGWWGWSRCRYTYYYRSAYTAYQTGYRYQQSSACCTGYTGTPPNCRPVCSSSCQNGGTCVSPNTCCCHRTGFTGSVCNNDCNECALNTHGCGHACVNTHGSFYCTCRTGYRLNANLRTCDDINECAEGTDLCDQNCHNTVGSYYCSCNSGYFLDVNTYTCHDVNECASNNGGCPQACVNTPGGFHCACHTGYSLNGDMISCSDINECATNNGGCEVYCTNTQGSFYCGCDDHEILDATGLFCVDHDECATGAHNCEQVCRNTVPYWSCGCNVGYSLNTDGRSCRDINECLTNNGGCAHTCTNSIGSYACSCQVGFLLDANNHACNDINECLDPDVHLCQHNCHNSIGSFSCSCNPGYTLDTNGKTCRADPCARVLRAPVDGDISCTGISTDDNCTFSCGDGFSLRGEFVSTCQPNHLWSYDEPTCTRLRCEGPPPTPEDAYVVEPCSYAFGQTCMIACNVGYALRQGTTERTCVPDTEPETVIWTDDPATYCGDVDECQINLGGCNCEEFIRHNTSCVPSCLNSVGSYACACSTGFILEVDERTCQDHDECALTDHGCEHHCVNTHGTYGCICNSGYSLDADQRGCTDIDECATGISGCNQTCTNSLGNYSCSCEPELYTLSVDGHACDDVDECLVDNGGCGHNCHNYYGGHRCSCRPGYTLQDDGYECVADPCEAIAAPLNGSITCSSGAVGGATDDSCTFSCHLGFLLQNANHRTCLPNHTWSGVETYCKILRCPILRAVPFANIRLPCAREYTSFCTMDCYPGYHLVGNADRECFVVDDDFNTVDWVGPQARCDEITPCDPTPCQHNAPCAVLGDDDFYCVCDGLRYNGGRCEIGQIEFPISGFSVLQPGTESNFFTVFATPDNEITIIPSAVDCLFNPARITITAPGTSTQFKVICQGNFGLVTVSFALDGPNAENYEAPSDIILYVSPPPRPEGELNIFEQLRIPTGSLPVASISEAVSVSYTNADGQSVQVAASVASTSEWYVNADGALTTAGVVYVEANGITIPIALHGAVINPNTLEVTYIDQNTINQSLSTNDYTANDIEDFISANSLANEYFDSVSSLFPSWIGLSASAVGSLTSVSESDLVLSIEPGSEAVQRPPCNSLPIETENLCVVLPFTGSLQVTVGNTNITFGSENGVCFVNSVSEGASSPIFFGGLDDDETGQNSLSMLGFMQTLADDGWNIQLGDVGFGQSSPIEPERTFQPFKNRFGYTTSTLPAPNLWINGEMEKQFGPADSNTGFNVDLSGNAYINVPDLSNVLDGPSTGGQWTCVTTGNIGLNIDLELGGVVSNFSITATDTDILSIFGGFPRDPITDPAGIFFTGSGQVDDSLFNQDTPDIDVYITLDENNEATGLGCVITGGIYITEALSLDGLDIEIQAFNWSTPTDNPLWYKDNVPESQFIAVSRPDGEITLNNMITILPDRGDYSEPSIVVYYPRNAGGSYSGYCYSRVNVFGASVDTVVITEQDSVFVSTPSWVNVFSDIPAYLWCRGSISGVYSWEDLVFQVSGYFVVDESSESSTFYNDVRTSAWNDLVVNANNSKERQVSAMEALDRADEALSTKKAERNAARISYSNSVDAQTTAQDAVASTSATLNSIRDEVNQIQPQIDTIQSKLNDLCTPVECAATCEPGVACDSLTIALLVRSFTECTDTCYDQVSTPVDDVTTKSVECWESDEIAIEQIEASCEWRADDYLDYGCRSRRYNYTLLSSHPSICAEPVANYPYETSLEAYECSRPCETSSGEAMLQVMNCIQDACGIQTPSIDCLLYNQVCTAYLQVALSNGTHGASADVVALLQREATAEQEYNEAVVTDMMASQMVNVTRMALDTIETEYNVTLQIAVNAQTQLQNITDEVSNYLEVYNYLQGLDDTDTLWIRNISFTSTQNVSNPNSILRIKIDYTIANANSLNYIENSAYGTFDFSTGNVKDTIAFDLTGTIVHSIINLEQSSLKKRDTSNNNFVTRPKRQQVVDPSSNPVLIQFQENCIQLQNADEMFRDLALSLGQIKDQYYTSYISLWNLMNQLVMLRSNYSSSGIGTTMMVNNETIADVNNTRYIVNTDVAMELGIDISAISRQVEPSVGLTQARDLIDSQINLTRMLMQNLGHDLFEQWSQQIRSTILGVQTDDCYSFADCGTLLINGIRNILSSTPADVLGSAGGMFEEAFDNFHDVTVRDDLTILEAYNYTLSMAQAITMLQNVSYWCAVPPNITEQPRSFGLLLYGQYYRLSCAASGTPTPTYTWWKDGELISDATESVLEFPALGLDDEGIYTCVASNLVHSVVSMPAIVKVETMPTITAQPSDFDTYVCSDNGAIFQVNATGIPAPSYQWYFQHITSTVSEPIPDATSSVLFIERPQAENAGFYHCYVNNSRGSIVSESARLHLLEFEVSRLSALVEFNIEQCSGISATNVYTYTLVGEDYSTAYYEVVTSALDDLTDINLSDPLNYYSEYDISADGGRIVIDVVTPRYDINDQECAGIVAVAEHLTRVGDQLNSTLTTLRDLIQSQDILFVISGVNYCINQQISIRPDDQLCPSNGRAVFEGILCPECPPGALQSTDDGLQICVDCPKGTHQMMAGQTSCVTCPTNTTTEFSGTRSEESCYLPCEPGYISTNGLETAPRGAAADCKPCKVGHYQPEKEARSCIACPNGENTTSIGSIYQNQCLGKCDPGCVNPVTGLTPCRKCGKGQYIGFSQSTYCLTCPEGQSTLEFNDSPCGATSISDCRDVCLPGSYSIDQTGLAPCEMCIKDSYQENADQNGCDTCPSLYGTLTIGSSSRSQCLKKCGPGNYSENGYEPCKLCDYGYYQDKYEQMSCLQCPPKLTTHSNGTTKQDDCIPGSVKPVGPGAIGGDPTPSPNHYGGHTTLEIALAVGISMLVLVVFAVILIGALIFFKTRSSDPVVVKERQLTEDKSVQWTGGQGNLRVDPSNRISRLSTATDGFSNPVYTMEDAVSTCEDDNITSDLVHNPVYMDDDMLQDDNAMGNPLYAGAGDDASMDNALYEDGYN